MKHLAMIILAAAAVTISSCGGGDNRNRPSKADINRTVEQARKDVAIVASTAEGTTDRQRALIDIRVRENRLRQAGYETLAGIYISEAEDLLADSLGIVTRL